MIEISIEFKKTENYSHKGIISNNKDILGFGYMDLKHPDICELISCNIINNDNNTYILFDGLIRSMLNYALNNGKKIALYSQKNKFICEYLINNGFEKNTENILCIDLESFFNQKCTKDN